jgi:hypothetical protein
MEPEEYTARPPRGGVKEHYRTAGIVLHGNAWSCGLWRRRESSAINKNIDGSACHIALHDDLLHSEPAVKRLR